ncbi:MAG: tRNA (guanine(26)-N(2))-dimethyltransferase [Pyrobaculum sp.]
MDDFVLGREGQTSIYVPNLRKYSLYSAPVFYNPAMEKNRTLSVLLLKAMGGSGLTICEPLAGTGVRGVRYAVESGAVGRLVLNDISKRAVEIIRKNLALNGVEGEVYNEDAGVLLLKLRGRCDMVDIDPFGSPAPYLQAAFRAVREEGIICATATDTAVLAGRYQRKCLRRYGSVIQKTPFYIEVGVRNLLGYMARVAASEDYAIYPLFSYWEGHYFRTCVHVESGARDADDMLSKIGHVEYLRGVRRARRRPTGHTSGPLWVGALGDPLVVNKMSQFGPHGDFLSLLEGEYAVDTPWFFRLAEFAVEGKSPTLGEALLSLRKSGVYAVRTHMASDGFKTEASYGEVRRVLKDHPRAGDGQKDNGGGAAGQWKNYSG